MQLQLTFLDLTDPPPSPPPTNPPPWEQIDDAARTVALEILAVLIARMLAGQETTEMSDE